jgi:8-oxo-dGTP pyrophosphatase MutT (NUDIX family)
MERREILAQIRASLGPDQVGQFCFSCGAPGVSIEETPAGEIFVCHAAGHRSPRAFIFDGRAIFAFEGDALIHEAAGAIIRRQAGSESLTLLFLRRKFPYQYTLPAGHIEIGQDPEAAMRREVNEEAGLTVLNSVLLWPGESLRLEDSCRRGADIHRWHVFKVVAEGQPRLSDEGRIIGWYSDDEIRELAVRNLLTSPVHTIFTRLGLIKNDSNSLSGVKHD